MDEQKENRENENKCENWCCRGMATGKHGNCYGYGGHGHHFLRFILGIAILFIVFSMGVKVGEVKQYLRTVYDTYGNGYGRGGHYRMTQPFYDGNYFYGRMPMMQQQVAPPATPTLVPQAQ